MMALKNLWSNGATKISIHTAATRKDMLIATGGGKTKYGANDWANALGDSSINNTLKEVDLSGLDVSTVTSFSNFFYNDTALEKVTGIANWDISNIRGLGHMFANTPALTYIDPLTNWDTINVEKTDHMFDGATSLTSVGDLSNWNLKNDTDASYMFANTSKLDNIGKLDNWFPQGSKITTIKSMFDAASSLTSVGNISNWDTSNVNDMGQLFRSDTKLATIGDLSNWNVSNVTRMAGMFQGIAASSIGDLSNWDTNKVTNMDYMFAFTPNLTNVGNLSATATDDRPGWNNSGTLQVAYRMFFHAGIKNVDVSGWKFSDSLSKTPSGIDNTGKSYIGPMTLAKRNNDMFAYLENPATITINDWPSNVTANLHAADFDGYQPLIVISNDSNLQNLNSDEITSEQVSGIDHKADHVGTKGHVANTVTFVTESEPTKAVASQQQDFVFANEDALNTALTKIPATDNWKDLTVNSSSTKLGDVAQADSGKYLNGQHNATQTPAYEGNYGKIAGTYSVVADTQDVTEDLIKGNNYPADHMKKATYQVVEKFPASYKGEGTLTASEYAKEIGDSDVSKYEGYVYKIIANQTVTAYQTATKNLVTGDITYSTDYNAKYLTYETTTPAIWDHQYSPEDQTYIGAGAVDHPAGYTISADPAWTTPEKDANGQPMLSIYYIPSKHAFHYDFMIGASDTAAKNEMKFNSLPDSHNFYINYTADTQNGQISYVDEDGKEVGTTPLTGKTGEEVTITPVAPDGYVLVPNQNIPATETATADGIPDVTVKVVPATIEVTPDDPKTPSDKLPDGTKTATTYPDKDNYPAGVSKDDLNKTVTRKITVTKPDGTSTVITQEVKFTRTATVNLANGNVEYSDWAVDGSDSLDSYTAPEIPGYTASETVPAINNVKDTDSFDDVTINYTANDQTGKISYVDENGKEISSTELTGKTGAEVTVKPEAPAGWKIVSDQDIPSEVTATADGIPTVTVKVEHATVVVQPDDPKTPSDKLPDNPDKNYPSGVSKDDLNKTITRTIKITKPDGTVIDKTQTLSFERTATVDEVTGEVTYGDWTPVKDGSASFGEVDVPQVPGYTPTQSNVPAQSLTNDEITNWQDTPVNVTYTANDQTGKISYVDENGNEISSTELTGKTGAEVTVKPEAPAGWKIVSDQDIPSEVTATANGIPTVTVTVEHATTTVQPNDPKTPSDKLPDNPDKNYPSGVSKDDLNKTITRTIKITKPDGTVIDKTQTLSFERTATVDEVTGEVTYGDWTSVKGGSDSFDKVDVPEIPGYTASQDDVPAQSLTNDEITNWQDTPVNITYTADPQSTKIIYQTADGKQVGTTTLNGVTDQTIDVSLQAPEGYWIDKSDQKIPATYTFKASDNQPITVIVVKKEDGNLPPTTDDKKMAVIVGFKDQDGKVVGTQVIEGDEGTTGTFDLNIPDGYYSSSDQLTHTFKPGDSTVTVDVTKKEEHTGTPTTDDKDVAVLVEYTDPSGKVIKTDIISGKPGSTIQVPNDLPAGYQTTGDVPTTYTIGKGDNQVVVINVTLINADSGSTQPDQPNSGSDTPSSSANPGSDTPAQSGASDSGSAQPDQPSSGSEMPSSSADSAANSNSAAVTPSEPTSSATASAVIASDAPATSASAVITGQAVVTSATPATATPAQSQATQESLPQTGNDSRKATSIAGLALASLAGILGFGAKRKKENEN